LPCCNEFRLKMHSQGGALAYSEDLKIHRPVRRRWQLVRRSGGSRF
jgi:hypothetical protein